jgi:Tfp pilus assembly protein PilF
LIDELLTRRPDFAPAWAERGKVELARDRPDAAEPWLRKALDREPHEADTAFHLVLCLQRLGRGPEAAEWGAKLRKLEADRARLETLLARLARAPEDQGVRTEAGALMLGGGREAEGVALLTAVVEEDPANQTAHDALAGYYEKVGKRELAERHRRRAP